MKILADAHIPYLKGYAEQFGEVEYLPGNQFNKDNIRDKDVLIVRTVTHFDEKILDGSSVKLICSATIGYDHIDTQYCDSHNIGWRTAPGCNANSVEQYVTASLLHLADKYNFDLSGKTIGIVGVGNVGSRVAAACSKLGMRVLFNDPPREEAEEDKSIFVSLETIKRESDIITLHTPLTKSREHKTFHLADSDFFDSVARKPFIFNSCRGGVIDNEALIEAIEEGKVAGAVIDCWENEPNISTRLLELAEIATPHIAGYSADGKWTGTKMSLENINDYFKLRIDPIKLMEIPQPENDRVIDLKEVEESKQLQHAVWHTYNPVTDTEQLKTEPEKFYHFRSHYPLRREYYAYTVINAAKETEKVLEALGFQVG